MGDYRRVNKSETIFPSAARTAAPTSVVVDNIDWRGVILCLDVTAAAATPSITPQITARNEAGEWQAIWTAASAVTGTGDYEYCIYPGASGGNFTEVDGVPLPREIRIEVAHADADSITYSLRAHWII